MNKKNIIGAIVGGIIIFLWQFISWGPGEFHYAAQQYTPKSDTILQLLQSQLPEEGGYTIPRSPKGVSAEEMEKQLQEFSGKPWATIAYHKSLNTSMGMNMVRGLAVNILLIALLIWIVGKFNKSNFSTIFLTSLSIGLICFLNEPYTQFIWFESFDIYASLLDSLASWGLCGIWLGWWLKREASNK